MTNSLYDRMMSSVYGSLDSDFRTDLLSPSGTDVDNPFPGIVSTNSICNLDFLKHIICIMAYLHCRTLILDYVSRQSEMV